MRRLGSIVFALAVACTVSAQISQQPDTTNLAEYMAVVDSMLRIEEQKEMEREAAVLLEAQQQLIAEQQRLLAENIRYLKIGDKFEFGPITRLLMRNSVDGVRTRIGGRTTANLHPQLFWQGYVSRGFKSKQNYFSSQITYTFDKKQKRPDEYPQRSISWLAMRELGMPSEILRKASDEGLLTSLRWTSVNQFVRYNRQQASIEYEWNRHLKNRLQLTTNSLATVGNWERVEFHTADIGLQTELRPTRHSVVSLSHRTGIKGFLKGDHDFNLSELSYTDKLPLWHGSLGIDAQAAVQWNSVPFLLLCFPSANMSYFSESSTFSLINNYEFANDRYLQLMLNWDFGGVFLSRINLLRQLGCHEFLGVRTLWGTVSDKNNYHISQMDGTKPYLECSAGICNILGIMSIEYVRRLNYLNLPAAHKQGIRIGIAI